MKLLLALVSTLAAITMQDNKTFNQLKQLEGTWSMPDKNMERIYETWRITGPAQITGTGYSFSARPGSVGDTILHEKFTIEVNGNDIYFKPRNRITYAVLDSFKLVSAEKNKFVFENKAHDYPQRITYHRVSKKSLHAWIEGKDKGVEKRFDYRFKKD